MLSCLVSHELEVLDRDFIIISIIECYTISEYFFTKSNRKRNKVAIESLNELLVSSNNEFL